MLRGTGYELGFARLSGLEITGLVIVGLCVIFGLWMLPEFIRYMKIRHM